MGFTPLEGLVMATRSGSVDPGLVLWLEEHAGMPPARAGGRPGEPLRAARPGRDRGHARGADPRRRGDAARGSALDVYLHRLRACIAAMAAAMGGLDALVFTGGVGENSPEVRSARGGRARLPRRRRGPERNTAEAAEGDPADREITAPRRPGPAFVVAAREDIEIAAQVRAVLAGSGGG